MDWISDPDEAEDFSFGAEDGENLLEYDEDYDEVDD